ncbi:MAG: hypothetical protein H0W72_07475 [Planctomycetes bacterium]|nr:hypothetical protein [Planctomycetota bacterium]
MGGNSLQRAELEQSTHGILTDVAGRSDLLVSFGGVRQGLGVPVFEFFNSIADLDCDKIFIRDFSAAWYQKGVDAEIDSLDKLIGFLRSSITRSAYGRVCFIGNSMGGYAAILFGSIVDAHRVIAFAPQSYIDWWNRLVSRDRRWKQEIGLVHRNERRNSTYFDLKKHLERTAYRTRIDLYYSPDHRLDRKHCERLSGSRNVVLHPLAEGGHEVVKAIRDKGQLKELIRSAFGPT